MQVKSSKEVEEKLLKPTFSSVNTSISNVIEKPLNKPSFLGQKIAANISNNKLVQGSTNKDYEFDDTVTNKIFDLLFKNAKINSQIKNFKNNLSNLMHRNAKIVFLKYLTRSIQ